jgi:hypothetical protein
VNLANCYILAAKNTDYIGRRNKIDKNATKKTYKLRKKDFTAPERNEDILPGYEEGEPKRGRRGE